MAKYLICPKCNDDYWGKNKGATCDCGHIFTEEEKRQALGLTKKENMQRKERYKLTRERNESNMICEKIIDTKPTDKPNKLVQATNILEMVLLGASDLIDYLENNTLPENKSNLMNNEYKRVKKDIKKGYKFLKEYYDNR